jgi:hypothetical protein
MRSANTLAAAFLAFGWGGLCYIMNFVEPTMGFETPADFFDPAKVAAGYDSSFAWRLINILILTFPIAIVVLVKRSEDRYLVWSGIISALLLLVFGCIDRVGFQLRDVLPTQEAVHDALAAMLPVRFAVQKSMVVVLGLFAWRMTRRPAGTGIIGLLWGGLGWVVLALSIVFVFVSIPVPIAFFIWAIGLMIHQATYTFGKTQTSENG